MPDADLNNAVRNITASVFGLAGERYMICSAIVAVGDIADELVERFVQAAKDNKSETVWTKGVSLARYIRFEHAN